MDCPVCGAEAKNAAPGDFDGLLIQCKHCGDYGITDNALEDFLRLDFDARRFALAKAKTAAPAGGRPTIDAKQLTQ
jgi:hypothetical protein